MRSTRFLVPGIIKFSVVDIFNIKSKLNCPTMKNALECNITNRNFDSPEIIDLVQKTNRAIYRFFKLRAFACYDLTIVNCRRKMQKLNFTYRNKNTPTDVISVCLWDQNEVTTPLLGEIFIYMTQIKAQAKKYNTTWEYEFVRMLVHSILHLFGFHHEDDYIVDRYVDWIQSTLAKKVCGRRQRRK